MKIAKIFQNFFFLSTFIFIVWMLFFDANDFFTQRERKARVKRLEEERKFYQKGIKKIEKEQKELLNDDELLEKVARERYFMKKKEEDVYVIIKEKNSKRE